MRTIILSYVSCLVLMMGVGISIEWFTHRNVNAQWRFAQHQAMVQTIPQRFDKDAASKLFRQTFQENYPRVHASSEVVLWETYPNALRACVKDSVYGVWVSRCKAMIEDLDEV